MNVSRNVPDRSGRGRRALMAVIAVLALLGISSVVRAVLGPPGVGHFDSPEGAAAYRSAYADAMAELPAPTRTLDVATSVGTVRVHEWVGPDADPAAPPLVLVPGRSSGTPMWADNLPGLVAGPQPVFAFDLLGDAGMSAQSAPVSTIAGMADWMHEVLAQLSPDGAHVVGHSFGGALATALALAHPEDVLSLSLLEPMLTLAAPPPGLMAWTIVGSLPGLPPGLREHALGRIGGTEYDGGDPMARMIAAGTAHYRASLPTPQVLDPEQVAELTMPVYVGIADHDSLAGGDRAAKAAAALPDGTVEIWPDSTHSLPMQHADAIDRRILAHVAAARG